MLYKYILLKILLKNYNNKIKYEINNKCVLQNIILVHWNKIKSKWTLKNFDFILLRCLYLYITYVRIILEIDEIIKSNDY